MTSSPFTPNPLGWDSFVSPAGDDIPNVTGSIRMQDWGFAGFHWLERSSLAGFRAERSWRTTRDQLPLVFFWTGVALCVSVWCSAAGLIIPSFP